MLSVPGANLPGGGEPCVSLLVVATRVVVAAQERERDPERKGPRYNFATADGKRRRGDGRGDRRRAPGGAQGPHAAANDLDY